MTDFETLWETARRFRRASPELQPLLRAVYDALPNPAALKPPLENLLLFLSSEAGRTDANCSVTYHFITAVESRWADLPEEWRAILDDMSGTLQDSIYRPDIAQTFESTPEQLLARVHKLR